MPEQLTQATRPWLDVASLTRDDFIHDVTILARLYEIRDQNYDHGLKLEELCAAAKLVGVTNFRKTYDNYRKDTDIKYAKPAGSVTLFDDKVTLVTGRWEVGYGGEIYATTRDGAPLIACSHPIYPGKRLVNVDTGTEKLLLRFFRRGKWREVIVDKSVLASPQKIIGLADNGIAVISENAKNLIQYLHDIETLNDSTLVELKSVTRLGWIGEHGFSPYAANLVFDGEADFRTLFESVKMHGDRQKSLNILSEIRHNSLASRILIAASFASVLVGPCNCLPFFVHLAASTGSGKTVSLMAAASIWANPQNAGGYIQSFNSTTVAMEITCAFCNSLPMMLDELKLDKKDIHGKQVFNVYLLAQGRGKGRGAKDGGLRQTLTWSNCIITTGESAITGPDSAGGEMNRVINIKCPSTERVIHDGNRIVAEISESYGHAGREFIKKLDDAGIKYARELYQKYYKELDGGDTTEKQAMAAALIVAADHLATEWIFRDDCQVTVQEISGFLLTKDEVSSDVRGYDYMCEWVAKNESRFEETEQRGERYGKIEDDVAFIISAVFDSAAMAAGYSSSTLLSWMKEKGHIDTDEGRMTTRRRISTGGSPIRCVAMHLQENRQTTLPDGPFDGM